MDAWTKLVDQLDTKAIEIDEGSGDRDSTLVDFAMVFFFFFSTGGRAVDNESRPFSLGAFLNFTHVFSLFVAHDAPGEPSHPPHEPLRRRGVLQNEVLPGYHDFR